MLAYQSVALGDKVVRREASYVACLPRNLPVIPRVQLKKIALPYFVPFRAPLRQFAVPSEF
jgi:hypothetical protein